MNGIQPNLFTRCHRCYYWECGYCHFEYDTPKKTDEHSYCPDYTNREKTTKAFGKLKIAE